MSAEVVRRLFAERFGGPAEVVVRAPGRVNLIGEHTDYNGGFVFPAAIDRTISVAARRTGGRSCLVSDALGESDAFDAATVAPGTVAGWTRYAAGMAWALRGDGTLPDIEAVVASDLPMGSGLSSSAAIEMAFGVVWNVLGGLDLDNKTLAQRAHRCETQFVGLNCGIMDMMASALGREGCALFLDTRSLEVSYAPLPKGTAIVLCDTKTPRELAGSAYNDRRATCESAAAKLGVPSLRELPLERLLAARETLTDQEFRRAFHVVTEDLRSLQFAEALRRGQTWRIGTLMRGSHDSLRLDYEVTSPALDAMAEAAWNAPGCIGARMTGAGFGGACVALVEQSRVAEFAEVARTAYELAMGAVPDIWACQAVDGARVEPS